MNIAGVVILYNPDENVINNIKSYLEELDCLYVFDNTETANEILVEKIKCLPRVRYISFCENKGISFALNTVLKTEKRYQFLLTMDQDSRFYTGMMAKYKELIEENYKDNNSVPVYETEKQRNSICGKSNHFRFDNRYSHCHQIRWF